jgi:zinc protease
MRPRALALLFALTASVSAAQAPAEAVLGVAPVTEELRNGLRVVVVPWDSPGIVAYFTFVGVGSRDEVEDGHSGYAHLFEHMMFRGTETIPNDEYERRIGSYGADNNAFTTADYTLYTVTTPSASLDGVIELEADRFQRLRYDEQVYRTETGAVRGEYSVNASNPFLPMYEALSELAFTRHTYGHTTLGYLADIEAMPEEYAYSRQFFRRFYTPDNCVILVVGDVDPPAVLATIRERYGAWRGRRHRSRVPTEPEPTEGARRDLSWPAEAAPRLFGAYRIPAFQSGRTARQRRASLRETAALQVVHGLAFSESAPLYQRLVVEDRALVEFGSWEDSFDRDPGLFAYSGTLPPPEGEIDASIFDPVVDAVQAELDRIGRGEAEPARIDAVKSHVRYALLGDLETPTDVAQLLARFLAVADSIESIDAYLEAVEALTPEDVARVARTYLVPRRRFVVTLSHRDEEEPS